MSLQFAYVCIVAWFVFLVLVVVVSFFLDCCWLCSVVPHLKKLEDYKFTAVLGRGHFGKVDTKVETYG